MHTIRLTPTNEDQSPAIRKALAELKEHGGGVLVLEPGRHRCLGGAPRPDGRTHQPCVEAEGLADVTVEGRGATLVGRDISALFTIRNSRRVTFRGLTVEWDPLPHTSGRVTRLLPEEHGFEIEPLIPQKPAGGRIVQAILAYDPMRNRLSDSGWEVYQANGERDADPSQLTAEGHLRIFQSRNGIPLPQIGWNVVARHQVYFESAFQLLKCSDVLLEDITVHAVPGMAVVGAGSRDLTIRRIRVIPGKGGWMSATADAMHFNACRGTVTVEDSEFAGMGDDAINIHGMYGLVTARIDDRTLEVMQARMIPYYDKARSAWHVPEPGDVLEFGGGEEPLLPKGELVVAEARRDEKPVRTLVKFRDPLPKEVGEATVLRNLSSTPAVRIRRCHIHGNRARGMLLQTRDVVVEECRMEDISGAGLQICTDALDWWESLGSRDVTVRKCVFRRCNFGVGSREAALDIFSNLKGRQSAAGVHQRLQILDNTFEDNTRAAIHVGSADGVEVRGNRFAGGKGPAVVILNSRDVRVKGNKLLSGSGEVRILGESDPRSIEVDRL